MSTRTVSEKFKAFGFAFAFGFCGFSALAGSNKTSEKSHSTQVRPRLQDGIAQFGQLMLVDNVELCAITFNPEEDPLPT